MRPVRVYIDGFNVYHAIEALGQPRLKWLNYRVLCQGMLRAGEVLDEVNFFTAVLNWDVHKHRRHRNYLNALSATGVIVHEANFKRARRFCREQDRHCHFYEEKQTDVAIAVKLVTDALRGEFARAILVTAYSDQLPAVRFVASLPDRGITLVFPPGRSSRDLGNTVADRLTLTAGRLTTSLLAKTVHDAAGRAVAFMPAIYEP